MNRTEYFKTLHQLYDDLENPNGNFQATHSCNEKELEDLKKYAAVSLMAVDRYYSNLSKLQAELKTL